MSEIRLKASKRELVSKNEIKKMRKLGKIPANYYAKGIDNIIYVVEEKELMAALKAEGKVITLETEDGDKKAVVREVQKHPVSWKLLHVDFLGLIEDEPVKLRVPLSFDGVPYGVKNMGGVLIIDTRSIEISCLPKDIPARISVDVSPLKLKQTVHARDLKFDNITIESRPEVLLCRVGVTRAAVSAKGAAKTTTVTETATEPAEA